MALMDDESVAVKSEGRMYTQSCLLRMSTVTIHCSEKDSEKNVMVVKMDDNRKDQQSLIFICIQV